VDGGDGGGRGQGINNMGVEYGFDIIDTEGHVVECKVKNHKSL